MCDNNIVYSENYKGFRIDIELDTDAVNPWKDQDGLAPILVCPSDSGRRGVYQYGNELDADEVPDFTRDEIKANQSAILELTGRKTIRDLLREYPFREMAFVDCVNEGIREVVDNLNNADALEATAKIYNLKGIPAVCESVRGYSQGDYAEVLIVATSKFQKLCGNAAGYWQSEQGLQDLRNQIQLYGDWAFGNVYTYTINDPDTGEMIDSCGGFYGDYDADGNALSEARQQIDFRVEQDRKSRIEQVKTWIKNRVPYQYRHFAV